MDLTLTQLMAAGGIVGLFSASALVLFRSMRYEGTITKQLQEQIDDLNKGLDNERQKNERCHKSNNLLIQTLQKNGMEVPPEVWL